MSQARFDTTCSAQMTEPLPGTAKAGKLSITLEHQLGWSHDIFDGGIWGAEITGQVEARLPEYGDALQLVRKPGRIGQQSCDGINVYIAYCESVGGSGVFLEHRTVVDVEDLMTPGIRPGQSTKGVTRLDHPPFLIYMHGKRDRRCAIKDRPPATMMHNLYPEVMRETSHSKGHHFVSASVLSLRNHSFERLSVVDARGVVGDVQQDTVHAEGRHGHGIYTPQGQAAKSAVHHQTDAWGVDDVTRIDIDGTTAVVALYDGPSDRDKVVEYEATLEEITTEGITSSCGDAPGLKKGWVVVEVTRR